MVVTCFAPALHCTAAAWAILLDSVVRTVPLPLRPGTRPLLLPAAAGRRVQPEVGPNKRAIRLPARETEGTRVNTRPETCLRFTQCIMAPAVVALAVNSG